MSGSWRMRGDGVGMVADDADRTTTETRGLGSQNKGLQDQRRVHRGVEEPLEPAVVRGVAADLADPLQAARIPAKDQKDRGDADPRHVRDERRKPIAQGAVPDPDHRGLLKIRFRGGRERCGEQQPEQRLRNRTLGVAPMRPPHQHLAQPGALRNIDRETGLVTKSGAPFSLVARGHDALIRSRSASSKT